MEANQSVAPASATAPTAAATRQEGAVTALADGASPPDAVSPGISQEKPKIVTGRPANACARCKSRKIKCSYERPNCAGCIKAKVDCEYPSSDKSIWDYARSLEFRLKVLEESLASDHPRDNKRQRTSVSANETPRSVNFDISEPARSPVAVTDSSRRPEDKRLGPPSSSQALDRLPTAAVDLAGLRLDNRESGDGPLDSDLVNFDRNDVPPLREIEQVLEYFFEVIHPPHPIFHEPTFRKSMGTLFYSSGPVSAQTVHALYLILALNTINEARYRSEVDDIRRQAREYHDIAMAYIEPARKGPSLGRLQGMVLRLLFILRVPDAGDIWDVAGRAVRSAIDLGLHLDPETSVRSPASPLDVDVRRKLFWSTYILDRTVSIALGRPCGFDSDWINTQFPSLLPDSAITHQRILDSPTVHLKESVIHHAKFRIIQSDIHTRLFAVSASRSPPPPLEWFQDVHRRLTDWRTSYSPVPCEYISDNWIDLHFNLLLSMLYRPSPGNPRPDRDFLTNAVRASGSIIRIHKTMWRQRAFINLWLAIHHIFMSGVTYLNCIWNANSSNWIVVPSYVDALLDIQTCSQLLEAMTAKEPGTERMRDAFETVSAAIIRRLSAQTGPLPPLPSSSMAYNPTDPASDRARDRTDLTNQAIDLPSWTPQPLLGVSPNLPSLSSLDAGFAAPTGMGSMEITPSMMETLESLFSNPYTDLSAFQGVDFSLDGLFGEPQHD